MNLLCLKSNYVYPKMQVVTNVCFAVEYTAEKIEPAFTRLNNVLLLPLLIVVTV